MLIDMNMDKKELVKTLAENGIKVDQAARALGITDKTFRKDKELFELYQQTKVSAINKIGKIVFNKASEGDNACLFFYLKTQGHWKESNTFVTIPNFEGSYLEKCDALDAALQGQLISIEHWKIMHETISMRFSNEEFDRRLKIVEERQAQEKKHAVKKGEIPENDKSKH